MDDKKLQKALEVAIESAQNAGTELIQHYGKIGPESKKETGDEAGDVVTRLDRKTESFLSKKFKEFDPKIGFRGEEFGVESHADITWLVDPIDGTSHFIRGLPFCTTMIALVDNGTVVLAVINDFVRKNTYWAVRGQGAFMDGKRIYVSDRPLSKAVLSFEAKLDKPENMDTYLKVRKAAGGMVHTVNCGFEFSMVASGKLDARITKDPYGYDWDYAPGSLLVEEAGGVVRNHGKKSFDYTNHDFIAANPNVYKDLIDHKFF